MGNRHQVSQMREGRRAASVLETGPKSEAAVNGRIRRFLPGERNPAELTVDELARMVAILNATPRRCLGYRTPQEAFQDQLTALTKAA
jgi:IS30 family transposase